MVFFDDKRCNSRTLGFDNRKQALENFAMYLFSNGLDGSFRSAVGNSVGRDRKGMGLRFF